MLWKLSESNGLLHFLYAMYIRLICTVSRLLETLQNAPMTSSGTLGLALLPFPSHLQASRPLPQLWRMETR